MKRPWETEETYRTRSQTAEEPEETDEETEGEGEPRIRKSYEVITEQSARQGDVAEHGWEDEDGEPMENPDDEDDDLVENAVEYLRENGATEPSSSAFHPGIWYRTPDPVIDPRTGDATYYSCHLVDFEPEEEREIFAEIYGNEHGGDARSRAHRKWNRR